MGNLNSLLKSNADMEDTEVEGGGEDEMMRTPVPHGSKDKPKSKPFMALLDPRSPTIGVSRTPVEIVAERERERKNRMARLAALSMANGATNPVAEDVSATTPSGYVDPRSPAFDYKRTPIAFEGGEDGGSGCPMDMTPINDNELQVPAPNSVIRGDLRKRLFVSQLNDSLNASGVFEDNKEN